MTTDSPTATSSSLAGPHGASVAPGALPLDEAIVATVAYADVFDMPIDLTRLHRFLVECAAGRAELEAALDALVRSDRLRQHGDVVYLPGREVVLDIWADRTERADDMWPKAIRWGRRIGRVPNVRAVAVTGGLAVDSVAPHDDADFFIITREGRLWLTRLMVLVLVRIAERDDIELCPNYIVSESATEMNERALYVARELAQMVPIVGADAVMALRRQNDWMFEHLPNATVEGDLSRVDEVGAPGIVRRAAERVLDLAVFAPLERREMKRKVERLRTVRSRRPEVGAPDESSFSPDVCKGHMVGNAAGIDVAWNDRLSNDDGSVDGGAQQSGDGSSDG